MDNKYSKLLDLSKDWFWEIDIHGNFIYSNSTIKELIQYNVEEILNKTIFNILQAGPNNELIKLLNEKSSSSIQDLNCTVIKKDATYTNFTLNISPLYDKNNKLKGYNGICTKTSNNLKDNIYKEYKLLRNILNYIAIPVFYKDINGLYLGVNKSWENITGLKNEDIINKTVYDIAPNKIAEIYHSQDKKVFSLEENPQIYESEVFNKSLGKKYKVIFNKSAFFDDKGKVIGLIGTIIDLSEITKLEEENRQNEKMLIHQSKLAAMGEMIGNIAHQWRQPLSTITVASTGAKLQKEMGCLSDSQLDSTLTAINKSAQYLSQTIDDFRSFFNPNENKTAEFKLSKTINKTLNILTPQFVSKNIEIIQKIECFQLISIENELIQVLINILNNARDALLKLEEKKRLIFISTYKLGNNILIEIKDNAKGIHQDIIDRIFEPYFTTKHKSQGTGIGLFMSDQIIKTHLKGNILVSNENYHFDGDSHCGANFKIEIPL